MHEGKRLFEGSSSGPTNPAGSYSVKGSGPSGAGPPQGLLVPVEHSHVSKEG